MGDGLPVKGRVKEALYLHLLTACTSLRKPLKGFRLGGLEMRRLEPLRARTHHFHSLGRLHQDTPFFDISCSEIFESRFFVLTGGADTKL